MIANLLRRSRSFATGYSCLIANKVGRNSMAVSFVYGSYGLADYRSKIIGFNATVFYSGSSFVNHSVTNSILEPTDTRL